ncbi:TPA: hypothetical protein SLF17_002060 [Serratia marcescens]|uniref:hypothetical protein n=1 Tax=Serratia marcescens TaxID=615 RepID=UPI0029C1F668|nr:hypothetical protein [Serratia marcescens]
MSKTIFGYLITQSVLFDIEAGRLINLRDLSSEERVPCVSMHRTMILLLEFILERRDEEAIAIDEILYHVWDRNYLQSYSQRLWKVMKDLKGKLKSVGVKVDFIVKKNKHSYRVNGSLVTPIYYIPNGC